ncbi:hypothetical protein MPHLEI_08319 [Mycolicibacterium phlei RIVM601174]|nr:hypothetical protein MPHLEI_08319 [Mycolicibacterium phlei RIVM601174]MBF4191229.1 hypothetical protein [Mycolicibacterium phlei]
MIQSYDRYSDATRFKKDDTESFAVRRMYENRGLPHEQNRVIDVAMESNTICDPAFFGEPFERAAFRTVTHDVQRVVFRKET